MKVLPGYWITCWSQPMMKGSYNAVLEFGGTAIMTSPDHRSGTDRCAEAHRRYEQDSGLTFSYVVNVQGDEPLLKTAQLQILLDCITTEEAGIATLIRPIQDPGELNNPNVVKVVVDQNFRALYFSRAPIPFIRDRQKEDQENPLLFYTHIGLYAFRSDLLQRIVGFPPSPLEMAESLEQLRWMENGIAIQTRVTLLPSFGVDTPEDLQRISTLI